MKEEECVRRRRLTVECRRSWVRGWDATSWTTSLPLLSVTLRKHTLYYKWSNRTRGSFIWERSLKPSDLVRGGLERWTPDSTPIPKYTKFLNMTFHTFILAWALWLDASCTMTIKWSLN